MVEKRISKTPDQIRAEAAAATDADFNALSVTLPDITWKQETLVSMYRWNFERIERDATSWYSFGVPVSAAAAQQYASYITTPHVCEPSDNTTVPSCKICGLVTPVIG